ncbi:unnamed protein product, partial [Hapterophycus canaliculatus]
QEGAEERESLAVHHGNVAWEFHNQVPILGTIDRAIVDGDTSSAAYAELFSRVRGLANQIKAGLRRQWGAWEVTVLSRMGDEAGKVLSKFCQSREVLKARADELQEMVSHADLAEKAIMRDKSRAGIRVRIAKGAEETRKTQEEICGLEDEVAALKLQHQGAAEKKAELLEAKARREERSEAAAKRTASVVRLMELESESIGLEKEALVLKEKLDVELGLRLWCQPITLLPEQVVVAFAAPHDPAIKHQVRVQV